MRKRDLLLKKILFICTGNSARSIMAEALMNRLSRGNFQAFSAGSKPSGTVNPMTIETLKNNGISSDGYRSKPLDEFLGQDIDIVVTVCDSAKESCPVWPAETEILHWSFDDPAAFNGSLEAKLEFFGKIFRQIEKNISSFLNK